MIFAFNWDGFLEPNEIYSQNMEIKSYSTKFTGNDKDWCELWVYPKAWTTSIYAKNNDILSYLSYIEDSALDNKRINEFMREYMRRMEIIFPGYLEFIKEFLDL